MELRFNTEIKDNPLLEVQGLLTTPFLSELPSESTLEQAIADPRLAPLVEGEKLGRDLTANGVRCNRIVQGLTGMITGIPGDVMGPYGGVLSGINAASASKDWQSIALGTTEAAIDVALGSMGSIPVVGWVASLAMTVLTAVISRKKTTKVLPPAARYDKGADEDLTRHAIADVISTRDWTPLFMPIAEDTSWALEKKTGLYNVYPREGASLYGTIPGGFTGCGTLEVPFVEHPDTHQQNLIQGLQQDAAWNAENVTNTYDLTPSMARLAQAAWVATTASRTSALFNIHIDPVVIAWRKFVDGAMEAADKGLSKTKDPRGETKANRKAAWYALRWAMSMRSRGTGGVSAGYTLYDGALFHGRKLAERQFEALDTVQVAYCSVDQAAFRNPQLKEKLLARRTQLLTDPSRWRVSPRDIVDPRYRSRFEAAIVRPIAARTADSTFGGKITPAVPMPDIDLGAHRGRPRVSPGLVTMALGGTAAYFLAKKLGWI